MDKNMTAEQAAFILDCHNKWRRGDDDYAETNPKALGEAIDVAVQALTAPSVPAVWIQPGMLNLRLIATPGERAEVSAHCEPEAGFTVPLYAATAPADELVQHMEMEGAEMHEASSLAMRMWGQHYKDVSPNFELCDSVVGVITQIDNMAAGLSEKIVERDAELAALRERVKVLEDALRKMIGVPASAGFCEPIEGYVKRPHDAVDAMHEMAARLRGGSDE